MIVGEKEIAEGRVVVLPVGWQRHGNAKDALMAERKAWTAKVKEFRDDLGEGSLGWGLICGADSARAIVTQVVVEHGRGPGGLILKSIPGDPEGNIQTREVPMNFDVVDLITDEVLAEARTA